MKALFYALPMALACFLVSAQSGDLRSVEEVIRNIDDLLGEYDQDFEFQGDEPTDIPEAVNSYSPPPILNPQLIPQNSRQDPIKAMPSEQTPHLGFISIGKRINARKLYVSQ